MKKYAFIKKRIAYIPSLLLPLGILVLGVLLLVRGFIFNQTILYVFILMPLICMLLLMCIILPEIKTGIKIGLIVFLTVLLLLSFAFWAFFGTYEKISVYEGNEAVKQYTQTNFDGIPMPELNEIGIPTKLQNYYYCASGIFLGEAEALVCQYSEEEFQTQKELLESYDYQKAPIHHYEYTCEPTAVVDGYEFRMLAVGEKYDDVLYYPKELMLIGVNDTSKEIVYIAYCDQDLDYIPSLEEHIRIACGWQHFCK